MTEAEYIIAYRFGFGVNPGKTFDPTRELSAAPVEDPNLADQLSKRIVEANLRRKSFVDSGRSDVEQAQLKMMYHTAEVGDLHRAIVEAATTDAMFTYRLSAFWANHFSLGRSKPVLRVISGLYENALRQKMFGSFADLLATAELHPAMMFFLNLEQSVGPNSPLGVRKGKGLNENLGREILELHTLGVDGGYDQNDVIALAKLLTGWTVRMEDGQVHFAPNRAEPNAKKLLDKNYGDGKPKPDDLKQAFDALARHAATARFVSGKLAKHFFGPQSDDAAKAIESVFISSEGNLTEVYHAILNLKQARTPLGAQSRTDFEFLVSALRASPLRPRSFETQVKPDGSPKASPVTVGAMRGLTQKLWEAPSPKGWPDEPGFWLSPTVITARLKRIPVLVRHYQDIEPQVFAEQALGPLMTDNTRNTLKLASNRQLALGLALASPEFNRR
jgi:uncharacterized protein (DUF1800 family)